MTKPVSLNRVGSGYLWRFWFIAIAAWALQLFICYALVEWHCARPSTFSEQTLQRIVGIVTAVCFVAALVNLRYAFRYYRQLKKQKQPLAGNIHVLGCLHNERVFSRSDFDARLANLTSSRL